LAHIQVEYSGISCSQLYRNGSTQPAGEALRFILIELLRVLGTVTAEILTPSLHAALADVTIPHADEPELPLPKSAKPGEEALKK
jgi:hypothetical protein